MPQSGFESKTLKKNSTNTYTFYSFQFGYWKEVGLYYFIKNNNT